MLGAFTVLWILKDFYYGYVTLLLKKYLGGFSEIDTLSTAIAQNYMSNMVIQILILGLPLLLVSSVTGIILDSSQTRLNFSMKRMKFDWSKINFLQGIKKLISLRSLVELLKSSCKVILIGYAVYAEIRKNMPNFIRLFDMEIIEGLAWIFKMIVYIGIKVGIVMVAIGIFDYLYQWWNYERQIMMSKQEIKEEFKQTEGDPLIKGHIKQMQRKMAMMRMMEKVPAADAVVRNPTHFAVAIKYDQKKIPHLW